MVDREKVIKGLEDSLANMGCGYMDGVGELYAVSGEDLQNAIALLKEHENLEKRHEILVNHADTMLAMLKERNEKIAVLNRFIEQMPKPTKLLDVFCDGYAKVVRCKNCENKECEGREGRIVCGITGEDHLPDWFCADWERKGE